MDLAGTVASSFSRFGLDASSEKLYYSLEDSADRWNFSYTFILLCLMCTVSTANVYFLRSFECTTLQNSPGGTNIKDFIQATCWTQGTIALTGNETTPSNKEEWELSASRGKISFYQWVPFVLGLQAVLFLIPHLIWDFMASHTFGEDVNLVLERAIEASKDSDTDERYRKVDKVASQITRICIHTVDNRHTKWSNAQRWLQRKLPGGKLLTVGKRLGNRIAAYYLITKLLYIANLVGQLFLVKAFLTHGRQGSQLTSGADLIGFSYQLMMSFSDIADWEGGGSILFPRRSYCIVPLRGFGNRDNTYIASCALPVNMYNEKLFVFLWLWLSLVLCITLLSLLSWFTRLLCFKSSEHFLKTLLETAHHSSRGNCIMEYPCTQDSLRHFVDTSIRPDGVLMLRMIKTNAGAIIASEICLRAWDLFHDMEARWRSEFDNATATCEATMPRGAGKLVGLYSPLPPGFENADPVKPTAPSKEKMLMNEVGNSDKIYLNPTRNNAV